jgi:hypothetical protein
MRIDGRHDTPLVVAGTLEIAQCLWANAAKEADLSEHY